MSYACHNYGVPSVNNPKKGRMMAGTMTEATMAFLFCVPDEYNSGYSGERMSRVLRIQEVIIGARYRRTDRRVRQNDASVITDSHLL